MSQSAILAKLGAKLSGPPRDEADVVYLLVEIRKYLDHVDPDGGTYVVLRTYCNWPVHILLARRGARSILQSLDDALAMGGTEEERRERMRATFDGFSLIHFQRELRQFLHEQNLPFRLVDDRAWWGLFLKHYVAVVSDCPFVFAGTPRHPRAIRKMTLQINEATKSAENAIEGVVNVVWIWSLEFADDTKRTISNTYSYPA